MSELYYSIKGVRTWTQQQRNDYYTSHFRAHNIAQNDTFLAENIAKRPIYRISDSDTIVNENVKISLVQSDFIPFYFANMPNNQGITMWEDFYKESRKISARLRMWIGRDMLPHIRKNEYGDLVGDDKFLIEVVVDTTDFGMTGYKHQTDILLPAEYIIFDFGVYFEKLMRNSKKRLAILQPNPPIGLYPPTIVTPAQRRLFDVIGDAQNVLELEAKLLKFRLDEWQTRIGTSRPAIKNRTIRNVITPIFPNQTDIFYNKIYKILITEPEYGT